MSIINSFSFVDDDNDDDEIILEQIITNAKHIIDLRSITF